MGDEESPKLNAVVVITLPPADKPSLGKTITAITISGSSSSLSSQPHQPQQHPQSRIPRIISATHFSSSRFRFSTRRTSFGLLGISLIALILWVSSSPHIFFQSRTPDSNQLRDDDDGSRDSFIFPLYPKVGVSDKLKNDIQLKLGRFVEFDSGNIVSPLVDDGVKASKIKTAVSKVEPTAILPVHGIPYPDGLYYTVIFVGSPPRPYFLDIDTGSDLAWVQCDAPCVSCAKGANPFYKPKKGNIIHSKDKFCAEVQKTHRAGYCETCHQCDYAIEYADHSSSMGVLARDDLHLRAANGSLAKLKVVFGCAYDQQGVVLNSLTKTDGILGLSKAKVSFPSQLASQGIIKNIIGHCLSSEAHGGGYMFLGEDFVPHKQLEWVPMLNIPSMNSYVTEVTKISYGKKLLSLEKGHVVFDSGSSYTYLTKQAYTDLVVTLQRVSPDNLIQDESDTTLPICWRAKFPIRSVQDVDQFFEPLSVSFGKKWFGVVKLRIPLEGYLIVSNKGNVCLGILDGSEVHDGSAIVLGDVSLRGQLIVYDNVKLQIGWMQSDCVRPRSINPV